MADRISASTCNPTIMSCVDETSFESLVDAPSTAQPPKESDAVGRQASSRGADFARRAAGANGGTGGAPGEGRAPAEGPSTASTLWTQGACKTVVSNSVKALGDSALAMGIGASMASRIPAPALYGVAAKFVTAVAADGIAALSCEPDR